MAYKNTKKKTGKITSNFSESLRNFLKIQVKADFYRLQQLRRDNRKHVQTPIASSRIPQRHIGCKYI